MADHSQVKERIEAAFGTELTTQQLWALVRLAKHVRKYARSNAAFNNMANVVFPYAKFKQITVENPKFNPNMPISKWNSKTYEKLTIEVKGQSTPDDADSDDDGE